MSTDKRSVHTDALDTLGFIIGEAEARDAIHLAVEPVVAGEKLSPGAHVKMVNGKAYGSAVGEGLGIVDPFLTAPVGEGQRFWFVVYPRMISSLRHVWAHPSFEDTADVPAPSPETAKAASERWMRAWAVEHMSDDYYGDYGSKLSEESAFASAIQAGHSTHIGPYEDARDHIDSEWWTHWENITGQQGQREEYFSCSC